MSRGIRTRGTKYPDILFASKFEKSFFESIPDNVDPKYEPEAFKWVKRTTQGIEIDSPILDKIAKRKYTPDGLVTTRTKAFYLEIKGYLDSPAKERLTSFSKMYPDVDLRCVFYRNNKVGTTMDYIRWAKLRGFKACVAKSWEDIPTEWKE